MIDVGMQLLCLFFKSSLNGLCVSILRYAKRFVRVLNCSPCCTNCLSAMLMYSPAC